MLEHISTHQLLALFPSVIIAALGVLLLCIKMPSNIEANASFREMIRARIYLSASYFLLAASGVCRSLLAGQPLEAEITRFIILFFASWQSMLFTYTLITFVQPLYVTTRRLITQIAAIVGMGSIGIALYVMGYSTLFDYFFYVAFMGYCAQLFFYTRIFIVRYRDCRKQVQQAYSKAEHLRLRWVQYCFYSALGVGIGASVFMNLPLRYFFIFVLIYVSFYLYFIVKFVEYLTHFRYVVVSPLVDVIEENPVIIPTATRLESELDTLEKELSRYINDKIYTRMELNNEDTARLLGTERSLLTYYFKQRMNMDFRTWRTGLRVEEACRLMAEHPEWTMKEVSEKSGFSDKANFYRQFKKIKSCTPADYAIENNSAPE